MVTKHATDIDEVARLTLTAKVNGLTNVDVTPPATHHAVFNGMRLHWLDWGNEGATTILFLHGGGINARSWDAVCLALRDTYHCVALDQRGHGDSEWSPHLDYGAEAHLRDIEALVDHLGLDGFLLVGQSMGGMNSMLYASQHSEKLLGLVLVDVGPKVRTEGADEIRKFMKDTMEIESIDDFVARALSFQPLRDPELLRYSVMSNVRQLPDGKWMRKNDMRYFLSMDTAALATRAGAAWDWLPNITCSTLVTRGAKSNVFLAEDAEELIDRMPSWTYREISNAGHNIQGDNPFELADAIEHFLTDTIGASNLDTGGHH